MEPAVLSICELNGGASTNVIPSIVTIRGTMRTYSDKARARLAEQVNQVLTTVEGFGGSYELKLHYGEPALHNDPMIVTIVEQAIRSVKPDITIHAESYGMGGEDFSHITQRFLVQ